MLNTMERSRQGGKTPEPRRALGEADRDRFHRFLKIAADSPFPGERANALDAAKRLAGRHGLTLQEAARAPEPAPDPPPPRESAREYAAREMADIVNLSEVNLSEARLRADKERYERALRDAISRGLGGLDGAAAAPGGGGRADYHIGQRSNRRRKRDSQSFARVLLSETSLPLSEIVTLTGLDIYEIVGLKLRMRAPARAGPMAADRRNGRPDGPMSSFFGMPYRPGRRGGATP